MLQTLWVNGFILENGRFNLKFMAKKIINMTYYYTLNNRNTAQKRLTYLAKNIHNKIKQNNAMITQADRGKS